MEIRGIQYCDTSYRMSPIYHSNASIFYFTFMSGPSMRCSSLRCIDCIEYVKLIMLNLVLFYFIFIYYEYFLHICLLAEFKWFYFNCMFLKRLYTFVNVTRIETDTHKRTDNRIMLKLYRMLRYAFSLCLLRLLRWLTTLMAFFWMICFWYCIWIYPYESV